MRRVKTYMVERGRLCRCAHCASVRGAMQATLVPMSRDSDRRDAELMHSLTHAYPGCARCNVFGFRIEWLLENGLIK